MAENEPEVGHRGTRAIQRMVEYAPSTGGLALWTRHLDLPPDPAAPAIATDGTALLYGSAFEKLPLAEQVGWVAHEVLHIALRHPQRYLHLHGLSGDADLRLFNICADAIVNSTLAHLSWLRLPDASVYLDRLLLEVLEVGQPVEKSLLEWDVERLYRAIDDRKPNVRAGRQQTAQDCKRDGPRAARVRALGSGTDDDLRPKPERRPAPEAEADQVREWSERIVRAHAGDGAHSMLRTLIADVPKTRTPWEHVLRTQVSRSLACQPSISWSRPSRSFIANQGRTSARRRLPFEPSFGATKSVPRLATIVDVSGSIEEGLMDRFAREIEALSRRLEADLILILGDDRVQTMTILKPVFKPGRTALRDIDFKGGGGTDFAPLLRAADTHDPDLIVVLTDLRGPAEFRPRAPVIWAVPEANRTATAPFGRKLWLS